MQHCTNSATVSTVGYKVKQSETCKVEWSAVRLEIVNVKRSAPWAERGGFDTLKTSSEPEIVLC